MRVAMGLGKAVLENYVIPPRSRYEGTFVTKKSKQIGCFMLAYVQQIRAKTMLVRPIGYGLYQYACYTYAS